MSNKACHFEVIFIKYLNQAFLNVKKWIWFAQCCYERLCHCWEQICHFPQLLMLKPTGDKCFTIPSQGTATQSNCGCSPILQRDSKDWSTCLFPHSSSGSCCLHWFAEISSVSHDLHLFLKLISLPPPCVHTHRHTGNIGILFFSPSSLTETIGTDALLTQLLLLPGFS